MADNKKIYTIQINGIQESTNAVEALNKQLDNLEKRINTLQAKSVNINTNGGGSTRTSNASAMSEEEKLAKQIEQIDAKREAYSKEIYQNYLAAKDVLDDTVKDQKQIAASERLQAKNYTNTMAGMKQELADLKTVMNTTDLGDEAFTKMSQRASELTNKLKDLESQYGQFGRNVGNYQSAFEGMQKLTVVVGGVSREFNSAREASKTLKNELIALEAAGEGDTEQANQLREAYYKLNSAMNDALKTSKAMDEAMDFMESFSSLAMMGNGLKAFFGFDDNEITKSIQRLVALQSVLKGIETLRKQMATGEGLGAILSKGSKGVDKFVASLTGAQMAANGLTMSSRAATVAVRSLSIAMKGLGIGIIIAAISSLMQVVEKAGSAIQTYFKGNADLVDSSSMIKSAIEAENNALEKQRRILATNFFKGYISDVEYARGQMVLLTGAILDNINAMQRQIEEFSAFKDDMTAFTKSFTSGFGSDGIKVQSDFLDMTSTIKNIDGAKSAWVDFLKAVQKGEDVVTATGARSFTEWLGSFIITADDAKDDLASIGQIIAGDWLRNIGSVNIATDEGKKKLKELVDELDNDKVTHSVMMNLDKIFPDKEIIDMFQNVIKWAKEVQKSLEFEAEASPEGQNYWEQVRIDAKTGAEKVRAQIELDKKKEIADLEKYGKISAEHRQQIDAKYNRKLIEQTKQFGQQQRAAQDDLNNLRIQLMQEGLAKQIAQLNEERRQKIQKIKEEGILVGERTAAVNALYDKKILDEKKKWAADMLKVYEDLYMNIQQINRQTFNTEVDTASQNTQTKASNKKQEVGYNMLNETNFDDAKTLEEYYQKILEIEKNAANQELEIAKERLAKELEYNKQEEKLRHKRLVNAENGEYKKQLEAGKITQEQYNKLIEDENAAHYARMNALEKEYASDVNAATEKNLEETQRLYNQYFTNIVNDLQKEKDKIDEKFSEPVTNKFGMINFSMTRANYQAAITQYENLKNEIIRKKQQLKQALKNKTISAQDFTIRIADLKKQLRELDKTSEEYKKKQKELTEMQIQNIVQYVQQALQSINDVLSAVWDAQNIAFDKEQDKLDKWNDELDKKLDEQEEIVQKHKDNINSIEDELATARGSRREHLIDQLNAEMAAEREAAAQKKKLDKEKERAEKKQEELELKRKKAEYKRNLAQAIINGAMSISMAAINYYPVPAIPMMAMAAASTAAQIAIIASNKPYAKGGQLDGGVAQGNRHRDGGIPVLGGRASIEGGEFITNRQTTAKNVDLLEYINSKKKKIDISDLMEFYSTTPRKTIRAVRSKFEDGGYLPTLPNALDVRDQLQNVVVNQDNRPIYVSVVDINNKQEDVRRVQTLAGL